MVFLKLYLSRKSKTIRLVCLCLIVVVLIYLLANYKPGPESVRFNSESARLSRSKRNERPVLVEGRGNFEPDPPAHPREGPGERGRAHHLRRDQQNDADESESQYGMNVACSDEISLERSVKDTRLEECQHWNYPTDLPSTSVIIVFHNEGWSVLMRTVHSVLLRSPPNVLKEVLLVDDFSDKKNLKERLEEYIEQFNGKVRLIRNTEREGLIRTRSRGAKEALGDVIVFLDAHCEVNTNWLPPLLAPIYRDPTTMTVPVIDGIDHKTFQYRPVYGDERHYRGIFEWGMLYKENDVPDRELATRTHTSEPYKSPTHAGGLFAIDRAYFLELGAYDPGLLVWGGENFELSFKIWQCGGSIEWVPCSRVGHVYRSFMPYNFGKLAQKKNGPLITINYKRVIETWFDDKYKEFFYTREPMARSLDMGDISEQIALKKRLNCKSFSWFMENVAYDVLDKFPELPPNLYAGELRNVAKKKCLDTNGHGPPALMSLQHCHGFGNNQLLRLNTKGQLAVGERCVEGDTQGVKLGTCHLGTVGGPWVYDEVEQTLQHRVHELCMAAHPQTGQLLLRSCDPNNEYHQWVFKEIKPKW